jgi:putative ABC transport system substrate-binding protein
MKRREFIAGLWSAAAWPLVVRAQQASMPVVGFVHVGPADVIAEFVAAFRKGLNEVGYAEGKNVTVEYHRVAGGYDQLQAVIADLVPDRWL